MKVLISLMRGGDLVSCFARALINGVSIYLEWAGAVLLSKTAIGRTTIQEVATMSRTFLAVREAFDPIVDLPTRLVATMARKVSEL